ncbi:MAG TPA: tRNA pseudouridine(38-40) synthase TruA [Candidatus Rubrimentiphilum sp.]|nr:tRNA pseudouridine(38-40) synthase TruA [Candidatus Rubrimentiphilum sp.]
MDGPLGSGRKASGSEARRSLTTLRAVVEYDGTHFSGFQFQPALRTVAGELERVFSQLLSAPIKVTAAGRTDAGVHATGQVVSFKTETAFPFERLALAANTELSADVSVRECAIVPDDFSARFSATQRAYVYIIYNRRERAPLLAPYTCHVWAKLDFDAMQAAAPHFLGEHDFRSFCGMLPESGPTIRTLQQLDVRRCGDLIRIELRADGFLHHMARAIVGTLIECGTGRCRPDEIPATLRATDRTAAGMTASAHGLYLAGVRYADGFDSFREPPLTAGT